MDRLIEAALQGRPVAWFSPTNKAMGDVWRAVQTTLDQVILRKNEQERRLELIGGGVVDFWSLDNPDSGRGRKYALVVIDEAAMIPDLQAAWQGTIRPTLTDMKGSAWFLSTPRGMNFFKHLFDEGQDGEREDWASWQMPTSENPHMPAGEIEAAQRDLSEAVFNQEYLALFVSWEGSVFRRVSEAATVLTGAEPESGHEYVIACDWGRSNDYTVFVVLDLATRSLVALDRSNQVDYTLQCGRLKTLTERWHPKQIIAEQNSIGQPIIEQPESDGLRVTPFLTTNASKKMVIEGLALAFERGEIRILNNLVLVSELVAYQQERLPSGLMRYSAPSGQHDDCVMALAIAWTAVSGQHRVVYSMPESDLVVEPFDIPASWPVAFAVYIGRGPIAVTWGALDPSTGIIYLYLEHRIPRDKPEAEQAAEITSRARMGRKCDFTGVVIPGVIGFASGDSKDQSRLIEIYRKLYLRLERAEDFLDSGIAELRQRMSDGKLKIFVTLRDYREEFRSYRHDETGQIVSQSGYLQDAARCLVASGVLRVPRKQFQDTGWGPAPGTPQGWMAG